MNRGANWAGNFSLLGMETFNSPVGTQKLMQLQRPLSTIIVSVTQGSIDVWLGNYMGQLPATPHLHFGQTNVPFQLFLPEMITDITMKASGNPGQTIIATLIVGGPPT